MAPRLPILVVDDDPVAQRTIARIFRGRWPMRFAGSVAEAKEAIDRSGALAAAVVDASLPDGSGADVLRHAHAAHPDLALLAYTGFPDDRGFANAAQEMGAEYAQKPTGRLAAFARRVLLRERLHDERLVRRLDAYAASLCLSLREVEVIALALGDCGYDRMAAELGVTENTVRTFVRRLTRKTGGLPPGEIAFRLRSEVAPPRQPA